MSSKTAIVFSCAHTDPNIPNDRFDLLGELIYDINPTYVVDLGDGADMKSLAGFSYLGSRCLGEGGLDDDPEGRDQEQGTE